MANAFAKILEAANKMKEGQPKGNDATKELMWRAETDKAGNGFAVIRFLPGKTEDDMPFVKMYDHGFQGPTSKWFIDKCPTTIGQECPVCQLNGTLWNSGREADKETVRKQKRRLSFVSNVLIVKDPANPDNEGKVFMFKYGRKIFDKIIEAMEPVVVPGDDPVEAINPFDLVEGADFKLKIRRVEGYANFDKSEFAGPSEVDSDVMDQLHDINQFVDPASYKSYDDLEKRLRGVLSGVQKPKAVDVDEDEEFEQAPKGRKAPVIDEDDIPFKGGTTTKSVKPAEKKVSKPVAADEDDDMAFFRQLAEAD